MYLFKPHVPMIPVPSIESKEYEIIKKMVSIVTSFMSNGNPNIEDLAWEPVSSENPMKCLDMSNDSFEMFELPEKERMKVWDEIFEDAKVPIY